MKELNYYIIEKLKIDKDSSSNNTTQEYKGIIIRINQEVKNYTKFNIDNIYEIIYTIIDKFLEKLNGYELKIFYTGYTGVEFKKEDKSCIGWLLFDKKLIYEFNKECNGIGCYFIHSNECPDPLLATDINDFVGKSTDKFKK